VAKPHAPGFLAPLRGHILPPFPTEHCPPRPPAASLPSSQERGILAKAMSMMTKQDGADIKAEFIKWMFLFWIGQIAVLFAAAKFLFGN
jgi:hypothetical protein